MNPRLLPLSLLLTAVLTLPCTLRAQSSAISIRVEQDNKSDMGKSTDKFTKTQHRALTIYVSNNSKEQVDLKVKYVIFGREAAKHDIVTISQGENPVTVKPSATEKVEIPAASSTSTEAHFDAKAKKKVDAAGASIIGQGVQVLLGDKVVAEDSNPASMKDDWGKTIQIVPPTAKPAAPAAKPAATPKKAS